MVWGLSGGRGGGSYHFYGSVKDRNGGNSRGNKTGWGASNGAANVEQVWTRNRRKGSEGSRYVSFCSIGRFAKMGGECGRVKIWPFHLWKGNGRTEVLESLWKEDGTIMMYYKTATACDSRATGGDRQRRQSTRPGGWEGVSTTGNNGEITVRAVIIPVPPYPII